MTGPLWLPGLVAGLATGLLIAFASILVVRVSPRRVLPAVTLLFVGLPLLHECWLWAGWLQLPWISISSLLPAVGATVLTAWAAKRMPALPIVNPVRRVLVELATAIAIVCCAYASMDLSVGQRVDRQAVILVVDRSRSIDWVDDAVGRIDAELRVAQLGMGEQDRIGVVVFADEARLQDPLRRKTDLSAPSVAELPRYATNIEAGLRRALAEVPYDAATRIVLVSDGVATRGDAESAAMALLASGVPVDFIPLDHRVGNNVAVSSVRAPSNASEGESIELKVALRTSKPARFGLRLRLDGEIVGEEQVQLVPGEGLLRLTQPAPNPGLHQYQVELVGVPGDLDTFAADNSGTAFVRVRGRASVLLLEGADSTAAPMQQALASAGFVTTLGTALSAPTSLAEFGRFDLVVLSDIPASSFSPAQLSALASYCTDLGGGLLLMGGEQSLGPGGYGATPIEAVSPLRFDLKQERRRSSLAEVIVIDFSGSMGASAGSSTKLELANEAAARSAVLLGAGDRVGVAHVDTEVHWTIPLSPLLDSASLAARLRAVSTGGGGIAIDTALRAGYGALIKEATQLKHLLLFADGSDSVDREQAPALVANAYREGTTTSVVALGSGSDVPALEYLSRLGHGRFYLVEDAQRLPAVFAQETVLASRRAIEEVPFLATRLSGAEVLRAVDFSAAPLLEGYVVTAAKPRAEILLGAPDSDPLLAQGRAGIGRVGVFTSDFSGRWGAAWVRWPSASALFGQLGRQLMRPADQPLISLEASASAGTLTVQLSAKRNDGHAQTSGTFRAIVVGPGDYRRELVLEPAQAGLYRGQLTPSAPGTYFVTAIDSATSSQVATTAVSLDSKDELASHSDRRLLARIAELTLGKERDTLAGIFLERPTKVAAFVPWLRPLLVLGALSLLLSVAARRLLLPDTLNRWWQARAARKLVEIRTPTASPAVTPWTSSLTRLVRRPERAVENSSSRTLDAPQRSQLSVEESLGALEFSTAAPERFASKQTANQAVASASQSAHGAPEPPIRGAERARTAAEILLERRRRTRGRS